MISSLNKLKVLAWFYENVPLYLFIFLLMSLLTSHNCRIALHVAIYFIMILASLDTFCDVILDATRNYFYISYIDILSLIAYTHEKYELLFLFYLWVYELYLFWHFYRCSQWNTDFWNLKSIANETHLLKDISYFCNYFFFVALLLQFSHLPVPLLLLMKIQISLWQLKWMFVSIFSMLCESIKIPMNIHRCDPSCCRQNFNSLVFLGLKRLG